MQSTLQVIGYTAGVIVFNILWNLHIIHHSSEEFNLACALRQSITMFVNPFTFLLIPAALVGVPPIVIATVGPLHLFAQFWYHTQHIGKMGFLEKIIVTPSHHRVHHAINKEYLDKNLDKFLFSGQTLWHLSGSKRSTASVWNYKASADMKPIKINFSHLWLMIQDAWHTNSWKEKFMLWFKPTGYRPADVIEKYPVYKIDDPYHFEKYDTKASTPLHIWTWVQLLMLLLFVSYFFGSIATINNMGTQYIFWYGGFIFLTVYALTELMDRNPWALFWEAARSGLGLAFLLQQNDWFGSGIYFSPYCMHLVLIFHPLIYCNRMVCSKTPKGRCVVDGSLMALLNEW